MNLNQASVTAIPHRNVTTGHRQKTGAASLGSAVDGPPAYARGCCTPAQLPLSYYVKNSHETSRMSGRGLHRLLKQALARIAELEQRGSASSSTL